MKRRSIKETPSGSIDRETLRRAVESVHVLPGSRGGWEVQTLVKGGTRREFPNRGEAVDFASRLAEEMGLNLVTHNARPRQYRLFNGTSRPA